MPPTFFLKSARNRAGVKLARAADLLARPLDALTPSPASARAPASASNTGRARERRVARWIGARRAALDEIGQRLGWRAGDVDAVGAQVRDHARARLRFVQLGRQLSRAAPPGVRAVGQRAQLEKLERLAQLGEIDSGRGLKRADVALGQCVDTRGERAAPAASRRARQRGTVSGARGANSGRVQLPRWPSGEMFV